MPLPLTDFERYLLNRSVEILQVSLLSGVRYATVWNAAKGKPVSAENARKILAAAQQLTGIPYPGQLTLSSDEPVAPQQRLASSLRKRIRLRHIPNS